MPDYTPTTEQVRSEYQISRAVADGEGTKRSGKAFDRWHADVIRKAKVEALEEAAESLEPSEADNPLLAALIKINPTAQMVFEYAREALTSRAQQLTEES